MLETQSLCKAFCSTLALDRVSLRVEPGEIYCLLGANGAGKTTLINVFLNFHAPSGGTATVNGIDVVAHPLQTKRDIAYIPEQVDRFHVERKAFFEPRLPNGLAIMPNDLQRLRRYAVVA